MLRILTLALMAIVLVPSAAHLFEFPGKIAMDREAYFTVQNIYSGWALFAAPIIAAIAANIAIALTARRRNRPMSLFALVAATLIVVSLGVFFTWIFPANQATANWTQAPDNWEILRRNWEYGHAVNAIIVFVAFLFTAAAVTQPARKIEQCSDA